MRDRRALLFLSLIWSLLLWNHHGFAKPLSLATAARPGLPSRGQTPAPLEHGKRSPGGAFSREPGPRADGPEYVFRGVRGMPPAEIKKRGGLLPNNVNPRSLSSDAYKLLHHLRDVKNVHGKDSAYVSTTTSFDVAAWFAQPGGYVYVIKTTPNMVPVESSLDSYPLPWEREYSALGGVVFEQIAECVRLPDGERIQMPAKPNFKDKGEAEHVSKNMDRYRRLIKQGVLRPDGGGELQYDKNRFGGMSASPGQPQLAGYGSSDAAWKKAPYNKLDKNKPTWEYAHEFMESIGAGRGWSDRFPLFQSPAHEAKIRADHKKRQQLQAAQGTSEEVAPSEEESSSDAGVGDFLYEMSPAKPFGDLVEAIRTDKPVSAGDWLGILGDIGLEVLAWTPTPAAVGARALRFARIGYKASQAIKNGLRVAKATGRSVKGAGRVSSSLDARLETVEVKVPSTPAAPPVTQPVAKIAKMADKVKIPKTAEGASGSGLSPNSIDEMLEKLKELHVPDEPIVPVLMEVVKDAGKRVKLPKKPVSVLAERAVPGSDGQDPAALLQECAAFMERGERVPPELLSRTIDGVSKKLGLGEGDDESFLDNDLLWGMLENKFDAATAAAGQELEEPRASDTAVV